MIATRNTPQDNELIPMNQIDLPGIPYRTVWGWATQGIAGIRLEHVAIGKRLFTTKNNVDEFLRKVNARRSTSMRF